MIKAIAIDDEPLALSVIESLSKRNSNIQLLRTFTQPFESVRYTRKYPVDLIFCDIQMPSISGIELVRELPNKPMIVFTTAYADYAAISYELNAIDYLLKPINERRFNQAVEKAKEYYEFIHRNEEEARKYIFVRAEFSLSKIPVADISYIEGSADYLVIHVMGRKSITARMTMKEMLARLSVSDFVRIHRSFIVPMAKIESVRGSFVYLDGKQLPIGRTYMEDFSSRYLQGK